MSEAKVVIIYAGAASCAFASAAAGMSAVFTHPEITPQNRTGWLGRQDSNLGMAESKSVPPRRG